MESTSSNQNQVEVERMRSWNQEARKEEMFSIENRKEESKNLKWQEQAFRMRNLRVTSLDENNAQTWHLQLAEYGFPDIRLGESPMKESTMCNESEREIGSQDTLLQYIFLIHKY